MPSTRDESTKPTVILLHSPSLLRLWIESRLEKRVKLRVFSDVEEALAFARTTRKLDALVTGVDFGRVGLSGLNVARKVKKRFPDVPIFVFQTEDYEDPRLLILKQQPHVRVLSLFSAVSIWRHLKKAIDLPRNRAR